MTTQFSFRDNSLDAPPGMGCNEHMARDDDDTNYACLRGVEFRRKLCDSWEFDFVAGDNLTWPSVEHCCLAYHYAVARDVHIDYAHAAFVRMPLEHARLVTKRNRMPRSKTEFWLKQGAAVRRHCLVRKFCQSSHLKQILLLTRNAHLTKGAKDKQHHGRELMNLRQLLQDKPDGWPSIYDLEAALHAAS